jgi:uncharacterized membrane protein
MELNIFMRELKKALVARGIPDETAAKHVSNLSRSFTNDDLSEISAIQSSEEVEQLADSISVILTKGKNSQNTNSSVQPIPPVAAPSEKAPVRDVTPKPYVKQNQNRGTNIKSAKSADEDYFEYSPDHSPSVKAMLIFWVGLFLTLPITLAIAAVIFGVFAALFVALAGLIVAGVVILIAVVAAGAGISLVGIIFGITQLFTFPAAGIYEIGLGVMVAGCALFASILIYNLSIRFFPWVITLVGNLLGIVCGKIKDLFLNVRRECYKL